MLFLGRKLENDIASIELIAKVHTSSPSYLVFWPISRNMSWDVMLKAQLTETCLLLPLSVIHESSWIFPCLNSLKYVINWSRTCWADSPACLLNLHCKFINIFGYVKPISTWPVSQFSIAVPTYGTFCFETLL